MSFKKIGLSKICLVGKEQTIKNFKKTKKQTFDVSIFNHYFETDVLNNILSKKTPHQFIKKITTDDIPLLRFYANQENSLVLVPKIGVLEDIQNGLLNFIDFDKMPEVNFYGIFIKKQVHKEFIDGLLNSISMTSV